MILDRLFGGSQKYYGLAILFIVNSINFLDRLSIAAVLSDITKYFDLTSFQSGLLSTCFLGGFMLSAPFFGHLGDKLSRKWILICGIMFWSFAAFSASLVSKEHPALFFMIRILVGIGEASYSSVAPTIIADLFEPEQRKIALSIFYFAIPIGSGLGFLMGTLALSLGDWRWVFRITPVIGLLTTVFLSLLREPVRGQTDGSDTNEPAAEDNSTVLDNLNYLLSIRSFVWSTIGFTGCLFTTGALSWWAISYIVIAHNKDYEKTATVIFGAIVCLSGFVGITIGSSAAQLFRKFDKRADPWVCAAGVLFAVPMIFITVLVTRTSLVTFWILLFFSVTGLSTNWAIVSDMIFSTTLPNKRAFATSMQIMISHVFGDATSPFIVGFIRDELSLLLKDDFKAFQYGLLSPLFVLALGSMAFIRAAKFFPQDKETCRAALGKRMTRAKSDDADLTDFAAGQSEP